MSIALPNTAACPVAADAPAVGGVLLVEDRAGVREALADILEYEGYSVSTAANGAQALMRLQKERRPALVLLDLAMPVLDGQGFLTQLHREPAFADIPVVLLSGLDVSPEEAQRLGAQGFLRKPVDVDILLQVVHMFCGAP